MLRKKESWDDDKNYRYINNKNIITRRRVESFIFNRRKLNSLEKMWRHKKEGNKLTLKKYIAYLFKFMMMSWREEKEGLKRKGVLFKG